MPILEYALEYRWGRQLKAAEYGIPPAIGSGRQSCSPAKKAAAQKEAVELASTYELCKDGCKCGKGGSCPVKGLAREGALGRR
jgi:hypothetical protein